MEELATTYYSKGLRISKSRQHKDLWIVDDVDGIKFHTVHTSTEAMHAAHPPDKSRRINLKDYGRLIMRTPVGQQLPRQPLRKWR